MIITIDTFMTWWWNTMIDMFSWWKNALQSIQFGNIDLLMFCMGIVLIGIIIDIIFRVNTIGNKIGTKERKIK